MALHICLEGKHCGALSELHVSVYENATTSFPAFTFLHSIAKFGPMNFKTSPKL